MADPITSVFQTTLLVLYFVTPAATAHVAQGKKTEYEKSKIWTLQSTSQIPTESPNMCVANGLLLLKQFEQVSTVTVRAYCLCPERITSEDDVCDRNKDKNRALIARTHAAPTPALIIPIDPDTVMPKSSGLPKQ